MTTTTDNAAIIPGARVTVDNWDGVAWRVDRWAATQHPTISYGWDPELEQEYEFEDWSEPETIEDRDRVVLVMIGDDREYTFDVDECSLIDEGDYCCGCGQTGCGWKNV